MVATTDGLNGEEDAEAGMKRPAKETAYKTDMNGTEESPVVDLELSEPSEEGCGAGRDPTAGEDVSSAGQGGVWFRFRQWMRGHMAANGRC